MITQPEIPSGAFPPLRLGPLPNAFYDPAFSYELKYDGFRTLARAGGSCSAPLISRKGNIDKGFPRLNSALTTILGNRKAILDGAFLWSSGRSLLTDGRRWPQYS